MQQRFPAFLTFLVTDLNGLSFCTTNSNHRPINVAARAYFASALKTGEFAEAIEMIEGGQEFELLFSDVVMPNGMTGVELAREARRLRKGIKILLTSGYAGDVLERHRAVDEFSAARQTLPPGRPGAACAFNPA